MATLPLLIKGLYSNQNGTNQSIVNGGIPVRWNNTTAEQRGLMLMLDVIMTNGWYSAPGGVPLHLINLSIGGMRVLTQQRIARYMVNSMIRSYELLQLQQPGGQTIQFELTPDGSGKSEGAMVHCYHENQFAIPSVIAARNTAVLKQRIQSFTAAFIGNVAIARSQSFTVPTGIGNVVAIELNALVSNGNQSIVLSSLISVSVNGEQIIENAGSALFVLASGRPGLIFPIVIRPGSTIVIEADTFRSVGAQEMTIDLRMYFDDDVTGTKKYA